MKIKAPRLLNEMNQQVQWNETRLERIEKMLNILLDIEQFKAGSLPFPIDRGVSDHLKDRPKKG